MTARTGASHAHPAHIQRNRRRHRGVSREHRKDAGELAAIHLLLLSRIASDSRPEAGQAGWQSEVLQECSLHTSGKEMIAIAIVVGLVAGVIGAMVTARLVGLNSDGEGEE